MAGLDFIPGLKEAETKFRDEQIEAFAGVEPDICGMIGVLPFTPQMYLELSGAGNRLLAAEVVTPIDVAQFLWRVSPGFSRTAKPKVKKAFHLCISVLPFDQAVDELLAYVSRAWAPMPNWPGGGAATPSAGVWPSRIVDMFAKEYGWTEEYILNLPFRRLWQYANRVLERKSDKYTQRCPEVLRLRAEWLKSVNSGLS